MLIIDINKQKVHSNPHFDVDVVIVKGASDDLVSSLTNLTLAPQSSHKENGCCGARSRKVALATSRLPERVSKTVPQSIIAEGNGQFNHVFSQLSKILGNITPDNSGKVNATFKASTASRKALQKQLAKLLTNNSGYVETLRLAVQNSSVLNHSASTVTTRNIEAAIALYAYYSDDRSFSSSEGASTIASIVQVSTDTIARLATELGLLRRTGVSSNTRYFTSRAFGSLLIRTLQSSKFTALLSRVDDMQNQIDGLGSI